MPDTGTPTIVGVVPQTFIVEALGGPVHPSGLLDRFPDTLYLKSPESHLLRLMYVLLGPVGVGQIAKSTLDARLALEDLGVELFDLDAFYADPLRFGRILEEVYDDDVDDPALTEAEQRIRARDAQYRSRALDFIGGVRLGNSPAGMRLVARSGLGHDAEIVEHYRFLYDRHSDDPLGLVNYGTTVNTEEMVVVPRQEVSQSEVQRITIYGTPTGGYITPLVGGYPSDDPSYTNIAFNAPARSDYDITDPENPVLVRLGVQEILEAHPRIGVGNVRVSGGPGPDNPWIIEYVGNLAARDVPPITLYGDPNSTLTGGDPHRTAKVTTTRGGLNASDELVTIGPRELYHLQQALDRIRPVATLPTVSRGAGRRSTQAINSVYATSQFTEVTRFVTGNPAIAWPAATPTLWIERGVEKQAPRPLGSGSQHYQGFHNVLAAAAYTDGALADPNYESGIIGDYLSEHRGRFSTPEVSILPALRNRYTPDAHFAAKEAMAARPEPPVVTTQSGSGQALINGIYPIEYATLPGVPQPQATGLFWASLSRTSGSDFLEVDLGETQMVNFVAFETLRAPVNIKFAFDHLDQGPRRRFAPVIPEPGINFPDSLSFQPESGWTYLEFHFADVRGEPVYTRYLRIEMARRTLTTPFLSDPTTGEALPWCVALRNVRVGRNVSN
jgi:hypothetical protein